MEPSDTGTIIYEVLSHAEQITEVSSDDEVDVSENEHKRKSYFEALSAIFPKSAPVAFETALYISADSQNLAILHGSTVALLSAEDDFDSVTATFQLPDVDKEQLFYRCAWSCSGAVLAAASLDTVYVLDSQGQLLHTHDLGGRLRRHRACIVGLAILDVDSQGSDGSAQTVLLVLWSNAELEELDLVLGERTSPRRASLLSHPPRRCHARAQAMVFDHAHSTLVIVGQGRAAGKSQHGSGGLEAGGAGAPSVSWWRMNELSSEMVLQGHTPHSGRAGALGRLKGLAHDASDAAHLGWRRTCKAMLGGSGPVPPATRLAVSPSGARVAVVDQSQLHLFSLGESVSAEAIGDSPAGAEEGVADVAWWTNDAAVTTLMSGQVDIASVPSLRSLLASEPESFKVGTRSVRAASGRALLVEPIQAPPNAADDGTHLITEDEGGRSWKRKSAPGWRLVSMNQRTPEQVFRSHIEGGEYGLALQLARTYGMDQDEVYMARWKSQPINKFNVNDNLTKINNREWVMGECLTRIADGHEGQRSLLAYGIKETAKQRPLQTMDAPADDNNAGCEDSAGGDKDETALWALSHRRRVQLLQYLDRLDTLMAVHNMNFNPEAYQSFRDADLKEAAMDFCRGGHVRALELLLRRHGPSLSPHRLELLSTLPGTLSPSIYAHLLPTPKPFPLSNPPRTRDWAECPAACEALRAMLQHSPGRNEEDAGAGFGAQQLAKSTEHLVKELGSTPPEALTPDELVTWYKSQVLRIDDETGLLDFCLELAQIAVSKGFEQLQPLAQDVLCLQEAVHRVEPPETPSPEYDALVSTSLLEFCNLSLPKKAALMLQSSDASNVVQHMHTCTLDLLRREEEPRDVQPGDTLLHSVLLGLVQDGRVSACAALLEDIAERDPSLFPARAHLLHAALECAYACQQTDQWEVLARMLATLPAGCSHSAIAAEVELAAGVKVALKHVDAARLLASHGVPQTMACVRECASADKLLRRLLGRKARCKPVPRDAEWLQLWRDLKTLSDTVFASLGRNVVLGELCQCLLRCGCVSLARDYMSGAGGAPLSAQQAQEVAVAAAREYLYSSSSLDDPSLAIAVECLGLAEGPDVRHERDVIEALRMLPALGVDLLPAQLKQVTDRLDIVRSVLDKRAAPELPHGALMRLARLLGLTSAADIAKVHTMMAQSVLDYPHRTPEDVVVAAEMCVGLVRQGHVPAWRVCASLAHTDPASLLDPAVRQEMLGFALAHCDDDQIVDLLRHWRRLEAERHTSALSHRLAGEDSWQLSGATWFDTPTNDSDFSLEEDLPEVLATIDWLVLDPSGLQSPIGEDAGSIFWFTCEVLPWLVDHLEEEQARYAGLEEESTGRSHVSDAGKKGAWSAATYLAYVLTWHGLEVSDWVMRMFALLALAEGERAQALGYLLCVEDGLHCTDELDEQLARTPDLAASRHILLLAVAAQALRCWASRGNQSRDPAAPDALAARLAQPLVRVVGELTSTIPSGPTEPEEGPSGLARRAAHYQRLLGVSTDAQLLREHVPHVDVGRFLGSDAEYRRTLILCLASTLDAPSATRKRDKSDKSTSKQLAKTSDSVRMDAALGLAGRYEVARWEVVMARVAALLLDARRHVDDVKEEVLAHEREMLAQPEKAFKHLLRAVYPPISGVDHARLKYFYSVLLDCVDVCRKEGHKTSSPLEGLPAKSARLTKCIDIASKLTKIAPQMDLKRLLGEAADAPRAAGLPTHSALAEIRAHVSLSNVHQLAKLTKELPPPPQGLGAVAVAPSNVFATLVCSTLQNGNATLEERYDAVKPLLERLDAAELVALAKFLALGGDPPVVAAASDVSGEWEPKLPIHLRADVLKETVSLLQKAKTKGDGGASKKGGGAPGDAPSVSKVPGDEVAALKAAHVHLEGMQRVMRDVDLQGEDFVDLEATCGSPMELDRALGGLLGKGRALPCVCAAADILRSETDKDARFTSPSMILKSVVSAALSELAAVGTDDAARQAALKRIKGVLRSLATSDGSGTTDQHGSNEVNAAQLGELRNWAWKQLQQFCSDSIEGEEDAGVLQSRIRLLETMSVLTAGGDQGEAGVHWKGWSAPADTSSQASLLVCRSAACVGALGRVAHFTVHDVASLQAAEGLFERFLTSVDEDAPKLQTLVSLLNLWESEASWAQTDFPADSKGTKQSTVLLRDDALGAWVGTEEPTYIPVSLLHRCWQSLFAAMLKAGLEERVVQAVGAAVFGMTDEEIWGCPWRRALLTAEDAELLISNQGFTHPASAVKFGLLLPISSIRDDAVHRLLSLSNNLTSSAESQSKCALDAELLACVLATGSLSATCAVEPVFNHLCRLLSEATNDECSPLHSVAVPYAVALLTASGKHGLAGALVLQHTNVNPALCTFDGALVSLERFLRVQSKSSTTREIDDIDLWEDALPLTTACLHDHLALVCTVALTVLINDLKQCAKS